MTNPPVHLAIDLGASGGRVIAGSVGDGKLQLQEVHRFANDPVRVQQSLQWNPLGLWQEILRGLAKAASEASEVRSVGVDSWGVDYVLLDHRDQLCGPSMHYRDSRTRGMVERAFTTVPRSEIFAQTGVQFMEINTLYQLLASKLSADPSLERAESLLMMGDLFHWLMSSEKSIEMTNASTTQLLNARTRQWCDPLIEAFELPRGLFRDPTEPGTTIGTLQPSVTAETGLGSIPVVLPATHDTASAVLAVPADGFATAQPDWCYISSGTWSLMGCELPEPKIDDRCAELNFTNEGGIRGSTRLLKNIGGLWIFQQIRRSLVRRDVSVTWEQMVESARTSTPFALLVNPDDPAFVAPDDMIDAIHDYAGRTGQDVPSDNAVLFRGSLEGLALRYRVCLSMLESLVGHQIDTIHIVGGGSLNDLLCQMTADACNRCVVAGPVEATAVGNVIMQMLGTGKLRSVDEARSLVRASFDLKRYEPADADRWNEPAERFAAL